MDKKKYDRNSSPPDLPTTSQHQPNVRSHSFSHNHSPMMITSPSQQTQFVYDQRYIRQRGSVDFGSRPHPIDPPINYYNPLNNYIRTRDHIDQMAIDSLTSPKSENNKFSYYQNVPSPLDFLPKPYINPATELPPLRFRSAANNPVTTLPPFSEIESLSDRMDNKLFINNISTVYNDPQNAPITFNDTNSVSTIFNDNNKAPTIFDGAKKTMNVFENITPTPTPTVFDINKNTLNIFDNIKPAPIVFENTNANFFKDSKSIPIKIDELRPLPPKKVFRCERCNMNFGRKNSLRRHEKLHTGIKSFHCEYCNKSFSRRDILLRHYNSTRCKKRVENCNQGNESVGLTHDENVIPEDPNEDRMEDSEEEQ